MKSNLMKKEELKDALMTVGAMALPCPPIMATIDGIWSDTATVGYMGFAAVCGIHAVCGDLRGQGRAIAPTGMSVPSYHRINEEPFKVQ